MHVMLKRSYSRVPAQYAHTHTHTQPSTALSTRVAFHPSTEASRSEHSVLAWPSKRATTHSASMHFASPHSTSSALALTVAAARGSVGYLVFSLLQAENPRSSPVRECCPPVASVVVVLSCCCSRPVVSSRRRLCAALCDSSASSDAASGSSGRSAGVDAGTLDDAWRLNLSAGSARSDSTLRDPPCHAPLARGRSGLRTSEPAQRKASWKLTFARCC